MRKLGNLVAIKAELIDLLQKNLDTMQWTAKRLKSIGRPSFELNFQISNTEKLLNCKSDPYAWIDPWENS